MMATSSSSATAAERLELQSTADIVDTSKDTSDAVLPELTKTTGVRGEQRIQTLADAAHDLTSTTIKYDRVTEALSSILLLDKIVETSTVSDPTVATVVVSTVATTLTSKDTLTTESNVPTVHKQNVSIAGISSTFGSDMITTPTPISDVEAEKSYDDIHSNFESATLPDSVILPRNATTESEVTDIFTALQSEGDNAPTTEVSSALTLNANVSLKSSIDIALPSNYTAALTTKAPTTLTSGAKSSLKSEFQTGPASNFMTELTSDTETLTPEVDTTAALQSTTVLTSEVDSTSVFDVAVSLHSQNESSMQNDASTYDMVTQEMSSTVPVTTSAVADPTSVGAELGTTTLVSPSSTRIPHAIETSRTTKPVKLSSRLSTSSTKSVNLSTRLSAKDTSATVIPTKSRSSAFITTSTLGSSPTSLAFQKATTSHASSSLSYTFSTRISDQHDMTSLATTDGMKNYQTSVFEFNSTVNGTVIVDSYPGTNVALAVSLSLVFGLTFILIVSAVIYCLLRNYCHQFHHCCGKHTGRCKLCSYTCVENRHYHGLQQRLTETPDLISESVHAQMTRIARGSSHPDEIALLERSLDDQHSSLNELDQLVFEDPDLMSPTSELFVDCRLASVSSPYNCCSPENENFHHHSYDDQSDQNSATAGRARNNLAGACFNFPDSGMYARAREPRAEASNCGRWHAASAENPYLKPSCHAHVEPGPNWRPFHPYDPVYVPHHDPIGMQRRLEGTYVTSPRLRMKQRNLYEEVRVNADTQRLMPVSPPMVPSRGTGTDSINAPVAPVRVSSRPSPVVPNRGVGHGSGTPVAPVRVSSRSSPIVHNRGTTIDKNVSTGTPKPPARSSSRSSPLPHHRGAAMDHTGPSSPVTSLKKRSRSPPTTSNRTLLLSSINAPTKGSSRATGESSLLDRSLPKLPVSENSPEPSLTCFSGGQRDSTSSSATIPGHEYSRVDFGFAQQGPAPIVTTAEVEPYETDSDSCRDGAYESIDFPKNPPQS